MGTNGNELSIGKVILLYVVVFIFLTTIGCILFLFTHPEFSEYDVSRIDNSTGTIKYVNQTCEGHYNQLVFGKLTNCTIRYEPVPPAYYIGNFIEKNHIRQWIIGLAFVELTIVLWTNRKLWRKRDE